MAKRGPDIDRYIDYEVYYTENVAKAKDLGNDQWIGLCPFHDDEEPSFTWNTKTGQWQCKAGCGSGNIITFHARLNETSTSEAYRALCKRFNIPGPERKSKGTASKGGTSKGTASKGAGKTKASSSTRTQGQPSDPAPSQTDSTRNQEAPPQNRKQPPAPANMIEEGELARFPSLLDPDQARLKDVLQRKRGWTEDVIGRFDLRFDNRKSEQRILIPVRDQDGALVNIRRYRPGAPEGDKVKSWKRGYGQARLFPMEIMEKARSGDGPVILCEGEPDCLCALSHGLTAVTQTGGAGTWKESFNPLFKGLDVIIAYDNDEAGREGTAKVAKNLPLFARSVEILQWPELMGDKEDLTDWFVTHGKTTEELLALPRERVEAKDPNREEPDRRTLLKESGAYYKIEFDKKGSPAKTKVSNFTLEILKNYLMPDGVVRYVRLIHENGAFTVEADLLPVVMAGRQAFASWCYSLGNFTWKGTQTDLEKLWEMELEANDGKIIVRPDHIGWLQKEGLWLFADCAVKDGQVYLPDDDGIIWIGEKGYQPYSINLADEKEASSTHLPVMRPDLSDAVIDRVRIETIKLLKENLAGYNAYLALGFPAACAYAEEIFREYKFLILDIFGPRQCGKSVLAGIIMAHFGLTEDVADNVSAVSNAALHRKLAYYSSIPVWVDEYRNEFECQRKDSILRSAYDRIGSARGTLGTGIRASRVRAPLIITGESFPDDSALASRCAMVFLSEHRRKDSVYPAIKQIMPMLPGVFLKFVREKTKAKTAELLANIGRTKNMLERAGMDPRLASIYGILGAAFGALYNPEDCSEDGAEFLNWLVSEADEIKQEKTEKFAINEFLFDLEVLAAQGKMNGSHVRLDTIWVDGREERSEVVLWFKGIHNAWVEDRRKRGGTAWSYSDLLKYLRQEPYFKTVDLRRIDSTPRRAVVLDARKMPVDVLQVFESGWGVDKKKG